MPLLSKQEVPIMVSCKECHYNKKGNCEYHALGPHDICCPRWIFTLDEKYGDPEPINDGERACIEAEIVHAFMSGWNMGCDHMRTLVESDTGYIYHETLSPAEAYLEWLKEESKSERGA